MDFYLSNDFSAMWNINSHFNDLEFGCHVYFLTMKTVKPLAPHFHISICLFIRFFLFACNAKIVSMLVVMHP